MKRNVDLSIIIPYCQEWPQIAFTIRSIAEDLIDRVNFEIIAVDNFVAKELKDINPDRSHDHIKSMADKHGWLRYIKQNKKLSSWNARNLGVCEAKGHIVMLCDAHVVPSRGAIYNMFNYYKDNYASLEGSIHLPLAYHILENHKLIYALKDKSRPENLHYKFKDYKQREDVIEVPCMSACGLMFTKDIFNQMGGWPTELGIYGGGENYFNFTGAVLGIKKYIYPHGVLYHHGEKRGYKWNDKDFIRNRTIAVYSYGGYEMAQKFCLEYSVPKGLPYPKHILYSIFRSVVDTCSKLRKFVVEGQVMSIQEWTSKW